MHVCGLRIGVFGQYRKVAEEHKAGCVSVHADLVYFSVPYRRLLIVNKHKLGLLLACVSALE